MDIDPFIYFTLLGTGLIVGFLIGKQKNPQKAAEMEKAVMQKLESIETRLGGGKAEEEGASS